MDAYGSNLLIDLVLAPLRTGEANTREHSSRIRLATPGENIRRLEAWAVREHSASVLPNQ